MTDDLSWPADAVPTVGLTPEQLDRVLTELAAHESDCRSDLDPERDIMDPDWWVGSLQSRAAAMAYAHAQRIIREVTA